MKNVILALSLLLSPSVFAADLPAQYEVPVPPELKAFSRYAMSDVNVEKSEDGEITVKYTLPLALTGVKNEIEMTGSVDDKGVIRLRGEDGRATCDGVDSGRKCNVSYEGIEIDQDLAAKELDKLKLSPSDKAGFLQVSAMIERNGGDMQGTIHYLNKSIPAYGRFAE